MANQPLLGWNKPFELEQVRYPCFVSFKLDGWRAWRMRSEFITRNMKTVPNRPVQRMFAHLVDEIDDWDGELIVGDPYGAEVFRRTDALLKSHEKIPGLPVRYFVFDNRRNEKLPFWRRLENLRDVPNYVIKLDQHVCKNPSDILELEAQALERGYEGLCIRSPEGPYKRGRSTLREQYLLKLKRFLDGEGIVTGFNELHSNQNEAEVAETGLTKRSSHQAGQVPMGVLGSLTVKMGELEFRVGTGFSEADRREIWRNRDKYLGKLARVKYSPPTKSKPRQPRFLGWRNDL